MVRVVDLLLLLLLVVVVLLVVVPTRHHVVGGMCHCGHGGRWGPGGKQTANIKLVQHTRRVSDKGI